MALLRYNLKRLIRMEPDQVAFDALPWKKVADGLSMARLAKESDTTLLLYRISEEAGKEVFPRHRHIGGEVYLILQGAIEDEYGVYQEGEIVHLDSGSCHKPRGIGETVVLVLWPKGVQIEGGTS